MPPTPRRETDCSLLKRNPSKLPGLAGSKERGQTTAEFVLVVPFLLLLFFLIVDFGWLLKNWIVVTNAAREAGRCASAHSCSVGGSDVTPSALVCERLNDGLTSNLANKRVRVEYEDESVIVKVQADNDYIGPVLGMFSFVTGGALPSPMPLRAREEMRIENDSYPAEDITCTS